MKVVAASFNPDATHVYQKIAHVVERNGGSFTLAECETSSELGAVARDAEILIAWRTKVTAGVMNTASGLRLIMASGSGYDHIDLHEAAARSIAVTNSGLYNAIDVAQHTIALILGCVRRIPNLATADLTKPWPLGLRVPITHRFEQVTVAVIGYGHIGALVSQMLLALGFKVVAADPYVPKRQMLEHGVLPLELRDALASADVVSLHLRLDETTRHIIDDTTISQMSNECAIVNTSRGGLIDERALVAGLRDGRVACAALDVLGSEPPSAANPIIGAPNLHITGHSAGVTAEAEEAWCNALLATLEAYRLGDPLPNRVA